MPKIAYKSIRLSDKKLDIVARVTRIVREYKDKGYDLTLRQVYYQFVARAWIPEEWADKETGSINNQGAYKKLGDVINDARLSGLLDWTAIVDRTREKGGVTHWTSPAAIIEAVADQYRIDKWEGQEYRPEVWVEKDALEGVVSVACRRLDVPYFSCRGYTSQTAMWENAQYLKGLAESGITPVVIHLGDHDPSGIDMSRDIEDRVRMFMDGNGETLIFTRIALNMDQVKQYNPPENPVKSTDSRHNGYRDKFGDDCWELDALDPQVIDDLITEEVSKYRDDEGFDANHAIEQEHRKLLKATSANWDEVARSMDGK
jgi:hypothetical protein